MNCNISLVKIKSGRVIPMLIIKSSKIGLRGFRVIKYNENIKNTVKINKSGSLKTDMCVLVEKRYKLNKSNTIGIKLADVEHKKYTEIMKIYNKLTKYSSIDRDIEYIPNIKDLHLELKRIKKKIELCKMNNENYSSLERRQQEILSEIGFESNKPRKNYKPFDGYRVAVTKGYIKVY